MNTSADHPAAPEDPRLLRAVQEYLSELEVGRRPDRREFIAQHHEFAAQLAPYLDALDAMHAAAPLLTSGVQSQAAEFPAEPLGDFRIVRELGRGGMGVVYEAVQLSLGRRVALKVLPFAATLDARQRQRFLNEAQAAAQLHHTNIVPVYAVGCERGLHFYAMQLIEGHTLDAVIKELREQAGRPEPPTGETTFRGRGQIKIAGPKTEITATRSNRDRESFRTAARIIAQVADALEYAHNAGVVHRDIKPSNLLLDAKGNVWVTDFGLAQVSADASLTRTGDMLGTLRYMSPEQAAGRHLQIDQRSDVYSLGATLYELLTLQPVFDGTDRQTLLHQVLHDEPPAPRKIDRSIPIELETIVLKALAKSPSERYPAAADFGADLRRYLDERPVLARRPTLVDRMRKWMRRHPTIVGAAVILLAAGVVGLAVSTAVIFEEQDKTRRALGQARLRALQAEARFDLAQRSADEMIRIANQELTDEPGQQDVRRRLLETAQIFYQEFIQLRHSDPDAQADLAKTSEKLTKILEELKVLDFAWQHHMLREPSVRDDLRLNTAQRARIDEMLREVPGPPPDHFGDGPRDPPPEPRSPKRYASFIDEVSAHEKVIVETLSKQQLLRLRQIGLQVRGPAAFRQPEVVQELRLTSDQMKRVHEMEPQPKNQHRGGGPGRAPAMPPDARRRAVNEILAMLNEDQVARWRELTGEPFTGNVSSSGPPGPRGRR